METIEKQLLRIRRAAMINDLKTISWIMYSLILIIIISAIVLERIFYFSHEIRFGVWQAALALLCLIVLGVVIIFFLAYNNQIDRYKWSTLARAAGRLAFPKEDTIINALQLERGLEDSSSKQLSTSFVKETIQKMTELNEDELFHSETGEKWKSVSFIILTIGALLFISNWKEHAQSTFRWSHPRTSFLAPKPFSITCESGNLNLLGGDSAELVFTITGESPDSLFIHLQGYSSADSVKTKNVAYKDSSEKYRYTLEDVSQDYEYRAFYSAIYFWQPWEEITSKSYAISVTDRPVMEDLTITLTPPAYTGQTPIVQKGNQADISGLIGSRVDISLRSNRPLKNGTLIINDQSTPMKIRGKNAQGEFIIEDDGQFSIQLMDVRGISNRNPIPFFITAVQDLMPDITVYQPEKIYELGSDQSLPMHLQIEDDFGFSQLQVAYELHRPAYIAIDPLLSLFKIPIDEPRNINQELIHLWQLYELGLMPEDEVHFHFELSDNDQIRGPKKTITDEFIVRLPGLAELFTSFQDQEDAILDEVGITMEDLEEIREKMEELELDVLKQDALTWDQQQDIQKMLEGVKEEIKSLEEISEALNALQKSAEKHELLSSDLLEKFQHLQELVDELLSDELANQLEKMDDLMADMDPNTLKDALQKMTNNIDQIEQELDRFIDIFERIKAEQKMDELLNRIENLASQQEKLHEKIENTSDLTDQSTFSRLSEEEQRNVEEFSNIRNEMKNTAEAVKSFHQKSAEKLSELKRDPLMNQTYADLQRTVNQLRRQQSQESMKHSDAAMKNIQSLLEEMESIFQGFQQATTNQMSSKFQDIMNDILNLSKSQEQLQMESSEIPFNSPRLSELAGRQQILQDQLHQVMDQLMELSKETFAITPEIGKKVGMANAMMQESINSLAGRNGRGASNQQQQAMKSLNESAMAIYQSMNAMQMSGSASGYEQFLQQMQNMAGQQQGINDQSMQLAMGQMAASAQQGLMQRLLQEQRDVRKSLQQLMNEMNRSGEQGLGDVGGIAEEMDEVLNDLERKKITRKTVDRQQRILSRMLDSQKSMTQRGEKEERKSDTGEQFVTTGPSGLPADMGQRKTLTTEAMNRALKAGYPRDYQTMIRRYFNAISETEFNSIIDTTDEN